MKNERMIFSGNLSGLNRDQLLLGEALMILHIIERHTGTDDGFTCPVCWGTKLHREGCELQAVAGKIEDRVAEWERRS